MKKLLFGSAILIATSCTAQLSQSDKSQPPPDYNTAEPDLSTPEGTAYAMMMAMYRGDSELVDRVFHPDGDLHRVRSDGSVQFAERARWQEWVGTLETGYANEEIFNIEVEEFGNLATVWAPFAIWIDGEISGCGVNQLSMAKTDGEWKIISGMDVQAPKDSCESFKADYQLTR